MSERATFEAWAVMVGSACVGHRVFPGEYEVDEYLNHLREMSHTSLATKSRVRVTVEIIEPGGEDGA